MAEPLPIVSPEHPTGTTLLSRRKPENLELWGEDGVGYKDVSPSVCTTTNECPHYNHQTDATREGGATETPIHILIAAYRDKLCSRTLHNIFTHAENPNRVFVRVIDQTMGDSDLEDDFGCWEGYCKKYNENCEEYRENVRDVSVDASLSKGPTDARSKLSAMVTWDYLYGEKDPDKVDFQSVNLNDFCMEIDSHMDFSDNFDTELIFMHHRAQNDYAVLSTYVSSIDENNQNIRVVPNLCMVTFTSTIRNWGTKECRNIIRPKLTTMWGAGLSFHRCHGEINVPVDPYLDNVFDGEEGSRSIRFFTHGYDVYAPDVVLVTHDYKGHQGNPVVHSWGNRNNRKVEHESSWEFTKEFEGERHLVQSVGTKRVNMMIGIGPDGNEEGNKEITQIRASRYGLGTKRTLEQAREFTGIDLINRKMVANKCGNLIWVPYEESENYGVDELLKRGLTGPVPHTTSTSSTLPAVAAAKPAKVEPAKAEPVAAAGLRGAGGGTDDESEQSFTSQKKRRGLGPLEPLGARMKHAEERFVKRLSFAEEKMAKGLSDAEETVVRQLSNAEVKVAQQLSNAEVKVAQQLSNAEETILHPTSGFKKVVVIVAFIFLVITLAKRKPKRKSHKHKK